MKYALTLEEHADPGFVQYVATTYDGSSPHFVVDSATADEGMDSGFCQVNADEPGRIDFLASGVAAITAWGLMYKDGTTGGNVSLNVYRNGNRIGLSGQGGADPGAHEVDASCGHPFPAKAGDYVTVTQTPTGADNEGNYCLLLITRL